VSDFDPTDLERLRMLEERAEDVRRLEQARKVDDLLLLMAEPYGRRFVWGLINRSGCNRPSMDESNPNPLTTAFNEGRRREGLELQVILYDRCPDLYDRMLRERVDEQKRLKKEIGS
jgi:hypothetical protein